jgi:hypothetical protein
MLVIGFTRRTVVAGRRPGDHRAQVRSCNITKFFIVALAVCASLPAVGADRESGGSPVSEAAGQALDVVKGTDAGSSAAKTTAKAAVERVAQVLAKNPHLLDNATRDIRSRVMTEFVEKGLPIAANQVATWISEAATNLAAAAGSASEGDWTGVEENVIHGLITTGLSIGFGLVGAATPLGPVGAVGGAALGTYAGSQFQDFARERFWDHVNEGVADVAEIHNRQQIAEQRTTAFQSQCTGIEELFARAETLLSEAGGIVEGVVARLGAWEGVGLRGELAIERCARLSAGEMGGPSLPDVRGKISEARSKITELSTEVSRICESPTGIPTEEEIQADERELAEAEARRSGAYDAAEAARNIAIDLHTNAGFRNQLISEATLAASSSREEVAAARTDAFEAQKRLPGARVIIRGPGGVQGALAAASSKIERCETARQLLMNVDTTAHWYFQPSNRTSNAMYSPGMLAELDAALAAIRAQVAAAERFAPELEGLRIRYTSISRRVTDVEQSIDSANRSISDYDSLISRLASCDSLEPIDAAAVAAAVRDATALDPAGLERLFGQAQVCITQNRGILDICRMALAALEQATQLVSAADTAVAAANQNARTADQIIETELDRARPLCREMPAASEIEASRAALDAKVANAEQQLSSAMSAVAGICALRSRYVSNPDIVDVIEGEITAAAAGIARAQETRTGVAAAIAEIRVLAAGLRSSSETRNTAIDTAKAATGVINGAKGQAESAKRAIAEAGNQLARTEPLIQAALAHASCPRDALDAEVAAIRQQIGQVQSNINLLAADYALLSADAALFALEPCATSNPVRVQPSLDAAARLSLADLDAAISRASECYGTLTPLPPPGDRATAAAADPNTGRGNGCAEYNPTDPACEPDAIVEPGEGPTSTQIAGASGIGDDLMGDGSTWGGEETRTGQAGAPVAEGSNGDGGHIFEPDYPEGEDDPWRRPPGDRGPGSDIAGGFGDCHCPTGLGDGPTTGTSRVSPGPTAGTGRVPPGPTGGDTPSPTTDNAACAAAFKQMMSHRKKIYQIATLKDEALCRALTAYDREWHRLAKLYEQSCGRQFPKKEIFIQRVKQLEQQCGGSTPGATASAKAAKCENLTADYLNTWKSVAPSFGPGPRTYDKERCARYDNARATLRPKLSALRGAGCDYTPEIQGVLSGLRAADFNCPMGRASRK